MKSNGLSTLLKLIIPAFEQNISSIEKVHARFKAARFIGGNIVFVASLLTVSIFEYLAFKYWDVAFVYKISPALIMMIIGAFINERISQKFVKEIGFLILILSLIFSFSTVLLDMIYSQSEEYARFETLFAIIFFALITLFIIYATFNWSKSFAMLVLQHYLNSKYIVQIELINNTTVTGEVLTITRKHDYILKMNEDNKEIFIKGASVASVKLIDER